MKTIIKFNARGTFFSLPKENLEKYQHTLLNVLSSNTNIPMDIINDSIYVDVSPQCITHIIDYYNHGKYHTEDYFVLMDLKYLNLYNSNNLPFGYTLSNEENIQEKNDGKSVDVQTIRNEFSENKYYKIHTADNKIICVFLGSYDYSSIKKLEKIFYKDGGCDE